MSARVDLSAAVKRYVAGESPVALAREHGVSRVTIFKHARRAGLARVKAERPLGLTARELAIFLALADLSAVDGQATQAALWAAVDARPFDDRARSILSTHCQHIRRKLEEAGIVWPRGCGHRGLQPLPRAALRIAQAHRAGDGGATSERAA
ncbi:MAG: hypothetical protein NW203_03700 [Hyphomonadaceae bacterium]|nr:hypothetical protein [Hyphomonadaceae bacterium]